MRSEPADFDLLKTIREDLAGIREVGKLRAMIDTARLIVDADRLEVEYGGKASSHPRELLGILPDLFRELDGEDPEEALE